MRQLRILVFSAGFGNGHLRAAEGTYPTVSSVLAQLRLEHILHVPVITIITDYTVHSHWVHPGVDRYMVACEEVKEMLLT